MNLQLKFCVPLQNIFENVKLLNYCWGRSCWFYINGFDRNIDHENICEHVGATEGGDFSILHS